MSDQKKPEQKPEQAAQSTQDIVKQVAEAMMAIIPAAVTAAVTAQSAQRPVAQAQPQAAARLHRPKCSECGQEVTACEGKHLQMVVYPTRYPEHADYFQGVLLNGVKYLSNHEGHKVTVPAIAFADIQSIVAGFEQNEQDMKLGRKVERHSGTVSPHGVSFQPANQAWR